VKKGDTDTVLVTPGQIRLADFSGWFVIAGGANSHTTKGC